MVIEMCYVNVMRDMASLFSFVEFCGICARRMVSVK
jgi:hypothetical protein